MSARLAKRGVLRFDTHSPSQLLGDVTLGYSMTRKPMLQTKVHIQNKKRRYINVSTMTGRKPALMALVGLPKGIRRPFQIPSPETRGAF